tara:strand:+ start:259 stop:471 length:213 start_codon:yes stop_codon:yes gene_type:complete
MSSQEIAEVGQEWLTTKTELKAIGKQAANLRKKLKTLEAALLTHMKSNNLSAVSINDKSVYISMKLQSDD